MDPKTEPFDPYDDSQRLPDPGGPQAMLVVVLTIAWSVAVGWVAVRSLAYLLLLLRNSGGATGPALPAWAAGWLPAVAPIAPLVLLVAVSALVIRTSTADWNAEDRGGARMVTFIVALVAGALTMGSLSLLRAAHGASASAAARIAVPGRDPSAAAVDRPVELRVEQIDGVLHVTPTVGGTLAGRYLVRSRVVVAATGFEVAHHARELELPRFADYVGDTYTLQELESGYARWLAQPGATDGRMDGVLRCTCTSQFTWLAADSAADRAVFARLARDERDHALSVAVPLRLPAARR